MKPFIPLIVAAGLALGACAQSDMGTKQGVGAVLGGVGGAVAGAQFGKGTGQLAATAAGALLGAFAGNEIGKSLDRADQLEAERASQRALESNPTGQSSSWSNPDSGNSGSITPVKTYQRSSGEYCREFTQRVNVGGKTEEAYGTACRQPDGSWKIVNS
ncbi:RT0821/Lpp0805 family surface protein [Tistrella mobilis]|uniref:17 kDa surface antigen n=1 Tax=Tistrella mobilis (strain KA081020-065) TaxID=1110502 RepID=I3TJ88_TISMK|nr:RT0821/Lpp0805 family surface protein [Tistrella mobilis]AFK52826.1 17 kDa surface antigen precursor [Tistrella mobilis KA081020-065]MAM74714.1 hypothetical protein [Tistrella sp.]